MAKYCFSRDEEEFYGDFTCREDALAEAVLDLDDLEEPVWTAKVKHAIDFLQNYSSSIGESIVEMLDERLFEDISSDDDIIEVSSEVAIGLAEVVLEYLKNNATFNRYGVCEIEQYIGHADDD